MILEFIHSPTKPPQQVSISGDTKEWVHWGVADFICDLIGTSPESRFTLASSYYSASDIEYMTGAMLAQLMNPEE